MKSTILISLAALSFSLVSTQAETKEELMTAAKKLADKGSYSWSTTVVVPEGTRFRPGPSEGKTEKDGATYLKMTFGDNTTEAIIKGEKAAVTNQDGDWQSVSELENAEGPGRFLVGMVRNFKAPAEQAAEIASTAKELKKEGDVYSGDLTEEGAKQLMRFRRGGGSGGPEISGAKGSVKFWVKDEVLSKMEYKVLGKMNFNGNEVDIDRVTTTEFKDVGSAKVTIPERAAKKML
jgi:hypothetical protein